MSDHDNSRIYEHTDEEALAIAESAMNYVYHGTLEGLPLGFRGLSVFTVIAALREHDDNLYGDLSGLNDGQKARLQEIEADIDESVGANMQYYPFGHDQNKFNVTVRGFGFGSNWGATVRRQSRSNLLHETPPADRDTGERNDPVSITIARYMPPNDAQTKPPKT